MNLIDEVKGMVSIVIPCYNCASFLSDAVESALNQTYGNTEIIVIDDGSTDNSREIAARFSDHIKLITRENGGPAAARNTGIKATRGEYIAFLDSDDIWLPDKLRKQIELLEKNMEIGLVYSSYYRIGNNGSNQETRHVSRNGKGRKFKELYKKEIFIPTLTTVIRKKSISDVGMFDEKREIQGAEDADLWLRIANRWKIDHIDEPLAIYRIRSEGHCRGSLLRAYTSILVCLKKHMKTFIGDYGGNEVDVHRILSKLSYRFGISLFVDGQYPDARKLFYTAIKLNPFNFRSYPYVLFTTMHPDHMVFLKKNTIARNLQKLLLSQ